MAFSDVLELVEAAFRQKYKKKQEHAYNKEPEMGDFASL